ncbi:MAG: hypothetical protein H6709_12740 [Kofleriaceae bacterium]|nr:hypothetical protein [Kofleriaceae bacterium]MCB9572945.1 hypothetical protein [Kofleriaceae bacterium]
MSAAVLPLLATVLSGPATGVVGAHDRGDLDEVGRRARAAGAAAVAELLRDDDRAHVVAGIAAAPLVPDAWELLDELAVWAGGWDRSLAAPAALAAVRIARDFDGDAAIAHEVADDVLAFAHGAWLAVAARPDRWADVRVHALETAAHLAATRGATADEDPGAGYDLPAYLADADPEVRRAAAELAPQPAPSIWRGALGDAIAGDADPAVALAAAQALCSQLAFDTAPATVATITGVLGDAGATRLRAIFRGPLPAVPEGALVDAARCLAAGGGKDDHAALRALAPRAGAARRWIERLDRQGLR